MIWKRTRPELVSRAEVTIANPERCAKQLTCHLDHRVEVESTPDGDVYRRVVGRGLVAGQDDRMVLQAQARGEQNLAAAQDV